MDKSIHEVKAEFVYLCVRGRKKINSFSFEITVIILRHIRNVLIQKGF